MPPTKQGPGVKARLARAFLNFLDEHGDYRTDLETAAARAAAAEANSLFAKDRYGRKKKKRRGKLGEEEWVDDDDDEEDDDFEQLPFPPPPPESKHPQLPEDPYEQIQFYFRTFTHRTTQQINDRLSEYQITTKNWLHDELHHTQHVPILSASILSITLLLYGIKLRSKKLSKLIRIHSILGKQLNIREYLNATQFIKGRLLLQYSTAGAATIVKIQDKASKAEDAALASMRPYQRVKYERYLKLMKVWENVVKCLLVLGLLTSGVTLIMSLTTLVRGENIEMGGEEEQLDGHIYSLDGPLDSDGYPIGMREVAEENYAKCLLDAEEVLGMEDPTSVCSVESFFDEAIAEAQNSTTTTTGEEIARSYTLVSSPLRTKLNDILTTKLHIPSSLSLYLTSLQSQTLAYLTSLYTFLLFLLSHYIAHKIHVAATQNDPMRHFVISNKTMKADGTVEAKKGETEAQRKRRERMLQMERFKAQMAQLAAEAKQKVAERRERLEAETTVEREKEEAYQKVVEEQEEIVKMYGRQYMMVKAGVPDGAILNSFLAEGMEDEAENRDIIEKLKAIKVRRAEESRKEEELAAKKIEDEKKAEEDKEKIAQERLRQMKGEKFGSKSTRGGGSISVTSSSTIDTKSTTGSLKKASDRKLPTKIPDLRSPVPRPGSSMIISGNLPVGAKSDKRWDKEKKMWVVADQRGDETWQQKMDSKSPDSKSPKSSLNKDVQTPKSQRITPKKSNASADKVVSSPKIPSIPRRLMMGNNGEEKKKGGESEEVALPPAMPSSTSPKKSVVKKPPRDVSAAKVATATDTTHEERGISELTAKSPSRCGDSQSSSPPPIMVRISSSPDCNNTLDDGVPPIKSFGDDNSNSTSSWAQRPSVRDIQAAITAVENAPEEEEDEEEEDETNLAPTWSHTPAFEAALRTSNANWDQRPSSRDVMAKIRAMQEEEAKQEDEAKAARKAAKKESEIITPRRVGGAGGGGLRASVTETMAIIDERRTPASTPSAIQGPSGLEFKRKSSKPSGDGHASDDDISELSEPTIHSLDIAKNALNGRSLPPQALFINQPSDDKAPPPAVSTPMMMVSPADALSSEGRRSLVSKENMEKLAQIVGADVTIPTEIDKELDTSNVIDEEEADKVVVEDYNKDEVVEDNNKDDSSNKVVVIEETEEQKQRRAKAEARAKKMEAIAARRNAGEDDDESAVSGISKRHRLRRKKKVQMAATQEEGSESKDGRDTVSSLKSDDKSSETTASPVKVETEEEKQRKKRAEARAKKMEAMAARRNAGGADDDDTAVSGISRRHRVRRKKSALAAITPEERERNEWKKSLFGSVMNAEQVKWQTSIYSHVLTAETTKTVNIEAQKELEEQNAAAQRRLESKRRLDKRAKKFAQRSERFHSIREGGGGDDDDASVVSTTSRMRRRRKKSSARHSLSSPKKASTLKVAEEDPVETATQSAETEAVPTVSEETAAEPTVSEEMMAQQSATTEDITPTEETSPPADDAVVPIVSEEPKEQPVTDPTLAETTPLQADDVSEEEPKKQQVEVDTTPSSQPDAADAATDDSWTCDVCKIKQFDSYEAACDHEKNCKGPEEAAETTDSTDVQAKETEVQTEEKEVAKTDSSTGVSAETEQLQVQTDLGNDFGTENVSPKKSPVAAATSSMKNMRNRRRKAAKKKKKAENKK